MKPMSQIAGAGSLLAQSRSRRGWAAACSAAALLPLLAVQACSHPPRPPRQPTCPAWTRGAEPIGYPRERYLVGVGTAPLTWEREKSEQAELANGVGRIAAQIRADVRTEAQTQEWEKSGASGSSAGGTASSETRMKASVELEGVEIAERCSEPRGTTIFVLAVLDKQAFAQRVKAASAKSNEEVARLQTLADAAAAGNPLESYRLLRKVELVLEEGQQRCRTAASIDPALACGTVRTSEEARRQAEQFLADRLRFQIVGDGPSLLRSAAERGITAAGFPVVGGTGSADDRFAFWLQISHRVESAGTGMGLHFVRAMATIRVVRQSDGAVLATLRSEDKGGGASPSAAESKADSLLAARVERDVLSTARGLLEPH